MKEYTPDEMEAAMGLILLATTNDGRWNGPIVPEIYQHNKHQGEDVQQAVLDATKSRRAVFKMEEGVHPRGVNQDEEPLQRAEKVRRLEHGQIATQIEVQGRVAKGHQKSDSLLNPDNTPGIQGDQGVNNQKMVEAMRQEIVIADLRARIAEQERSSGMRVADFSGNSHRTGRSDDQDQNDCQPRHSSQRILTENSNADENNKNPVEGTFADDVAISDDATISYTGTDDEDGNNVCRNCGFATNVVNLDPCPLCCLTSMLKTKNKRRRVSDGEEKVEQAAKKAATGQERASMPSTFTETMRVGPESPLANREYAVRPRLVLTNRSNAVNGSLKPTEHGTFDISAPPKTAQPNLEVSSVRDPTRNQEQRRTPLPQARIILRNRPSPNVAPVQEAVSPGNFMPSPSPRAGKKTKKKKDINQTPRASINLSAASSEVSRADMTALETASTSSAIDVSTIAHENTRLNMFRELLGGAPDLPSEAPNPNRSSHVPEDTSSQEPSGVEPSPVHASKKVYEYSPKFKPGYDDKYLKQLARLTYASEENVPELEDSDNDVPDERNPGKTRRRIANTPIDDYPEPINGGDMRLRPEENVYWGAITRRIKNQTPQEYLDDRTATIWRLEIARMKERHAEIRRGDNGKVDNRASPGGKSPVKQQGEGTGSSPLRQ